MKFTWEATDLYVGRHVKNSDEGTEYIISRMPGEDRRWFILNVETMSPERLFEPTEQMIKLFNLFGLEPVSLA